VTVKTRISKLNLCVWWF